MPAKITPLFPARVTKPRKAAVRIACDCWRVRQGGDARDPFDHVRDCAIRPEPRTKAEWQREAEELREALTQARAEAETAEEEMEKSRAALPAMEDVLNVVELCPESGCRSAPLHEMYRCERCRELLRLAESFPA